MFGPEGFLFFVGSYSRPGAYFPGASGEGIVAYVLHAEIGAIARLQACAEAANATYLAATPDGRRLLVASDRYTEEGEVLSFLREEDGRLALESRQCARGTAVCHVACDPDGRRVFVASYLNGRLTAHDLRDGLLGPADPSIAYVGNGSNVERQERAHAHQAIVAPGGRWLHVCDLGSDRIWVHDLHDRALAHRGIAMPAGYGPRHLVHHPTLRRTYVLCELNAHVLTCERDDTSGELRLLDDQSTLPADYAGTPSAAAVRLHPSGRTLAVSNRGHDSISVFSIDPASGRLSLSARFASGGREPRDFNFDPTGRWLVAANQNSNNLAPFRFDPATGQPTGEAAPLFACGTPVCVLFP